MMRSIYFWKKPLTLVSSVVILHLQASLRLIITLLYRRLNELVYTVREIRISGHIWKSGVTEDAEE